MRFILHIGLGKTGSTSIQWTLRDNQEHLRQFGYEYWGLMLERAPVKRYEWQKAGIPGLEVFQSLSDQEAKEQMSAILVESCASAAKRDIHTIIWSHEAFSDYSPSSLFFALKQLQTEHSVALQILAYVRHHISWLQSAYIQWGINHKTYPGKIKTFKEYIHQNQTTFFDKILPWKKEFQKCFSLRNFSATTDVIEDFLDFIDFPEKLENQRVWTRPSNEEIFLRGLFNNTREETTLPFVFDELINIQLLSMTLDPDSWMKEKLPSDQDIIEILQFLSDDIVKINSILEENHQPLLLEQAQEVVKSWKIDHGHLLGILSQIIMLQSQSIHSLNERIKKLEEKSVDG